MDDIVKLPVCDCESGFCDEGHRYQAGTFCPHDATTTREQVAFREAEITALHAQVETLQSERAVQESALANLRNDLREAVQVRDAQIETLANEQASAHRSAQIRAACQEALRALDTYAGMYRHHMTVQLISARAGLREALGEW